MDHSSVRALLREKQESLLIKLLKTARNVEYGRQYNFSEIFGYEEFSQQVPPVHFSELSSYVERIKDGEANLLWPGTTSRFAVSSGTTGQGKHIPIFKDRLKADQRFLNKLAWHIFKNRDFNPFRCRTLSLAGSVEQQDQLILGEITGHLAHKAPLYTNILNVVSPKMLAEMPWKHKFALSAKILKESPVSILAGSPVWVAALLAQTEEKNLPEVLVLGGMNPKPYLGDIESRYSEDKPVIYQTYGASEGYLTWGPWRADRHMVYSGGNGVFIEGEDLENGDVSPIWVWETRKNYRLILSSIGGIWRLKMDDLLSVTIENGSFLLRHEERLGFQLNEFGEQMSATEIVATLSKEFPGLQAVTYHPKDSAHIYIRYCRGFTGDTILEKSPGLDHRLQLANRHYQIRRETGVMNCAWELVINTDLREKLGLEKQAQSKPMWVLNETLRRQLFEDIGLSTKGESRI